MNLDWNTFAPALLSFVGVFVGWGLKEFSDLFRGSREAIRNRKAGLYQLIRLHHEMTRVERILNEVKEASGDWKVFEMFRARYAERYGDRSEEFISGLKSTIRRVAETDPWSAVELQSVLETYISLKDIKLSALQQTGFDAYVRALSAIEATYLTGIRVLRKLIYSEARRCGLMTWFRTLWSFRKLDVLSDTKDPAALKGDLKKIFETLEKNSKHGEQAGVPTGGPPAPVGDKKA